MQTGIEPRETFVNQGQKGKELPKKYNDGTGAVYAAWVEGYVEHILWMDKCLPGWDKNNKQGI